ncbi:MAG: TetR/AcrR family transcriptional regulator C-terminal domain-containing protein [Saccharofermentans sp.]|nr:TetR/AcrR family transcriptional regulator C-terminal domain-containing protein [Saccharofermentans sp.]
MEQNKNDRRTQRTERALRDGLAELLIEKELSKITVREITDKADVNRVTFYKHYLDVYDLYEQIEKEILVDLGLIVLEYGEISTAEIFKHLLDYVDNNRTLFKMVFSPNTTSALIEKVAGLIEGISRKVLAEKYHVDISKNNIDYLNYYRAHGAIAIIDKWVMEDFVLPKEEVVKTVSELDAHVGAYIHSVI